MRSFYQLQSHSRDDLDYVPVLASLPSQMTVYEYLVGCWKRLNSARANLVKKVWRTRHVRMKCSYMVPQNPVNELQQASALLEKTRDLIISYVGLTLQEPEMFPQPAGYVSNCTSPNTTLML